MIETTQDIVISGGRKDVIAVLFKDANGEKKALRAFEPDATDTHFVNIAQALGAVSWVTLGEVSIPLGGTFTECDYANGETVARRAVRMVAR